VSSTEDGSPRLSPASPGSSERFGSRSGGLSRSLGLKGPLLFGGDARDLPIFKLDPQVGTFGDSGVVGRALIGLRSLPASAAKPGGTSDARVRV
jgi:hypothetical protein